MEYKVTKHAWKVFFPNKSIVYYKSNCCSFSVKKSAILLPESVEQKLRKCDNHFHLQKSGIYGSKAGLPQKLFLN
jgi:hypothetical protein